MLRLPPTLRMDDEQFFEFCRINRDWRIERTAEGKVESYSPAGGPREVRTGTQV